MAIEKPTSAALGKIYRFFVKHHETIAWPAETIGQPITLRAIVKATG